MGKGDTRTRKGKIYNGSYGNARPHAKVTTGKPASAAAPAKKAPAKKAAAKKA